jgi:hypothetical protein
MQLRQPARSLVIGICLVSVGCASFEPGLRLQELNAPRQPTAKATQEGLEVSVEEFITPDKSLMAFDTELSGSGVLALLMKVENSGAEKYVAKRDDIRAFLDGQPLTPLTAREAASQAATSEYVGKALGWTVAAGPFAILLWPVTIGASTIHTQGVNKRIIQYFEGTKYQDALINPKQTAMGFVYYKLPDRVSRLENFVVEAEAVGDTSGKKLSYKLTLPPLQLSK